MEIWLLCQLNRLVGSVTSKMERFAFDEALKEIRSFVWNVLADNYIEAAKGRFYDKDEFSVAALYLTFNVVVRLLAPFCPFFAEELFSHIHPDKGSVHLASWPTLEIELHPAMKQGKQGLAPGATAQTVVITATAAEVREAQQIGELIKEIISSVRRYKSERGMALNARIEAVHVYSPHCLSSGARDINSALNADVRYHQGVPHIQEHIAEIQPNLASLGPRLKTDAKKIAQLIDQMPTSELAREIEKGAVVIGDHRLARSDFLIKKEAVVDGHPVDIIELRGATVIIGRVRD